jgi:mRNA-degrading endonuclease HigB of HigAB toxin-antitoxin module
MSLGLDHGRRAAVQNAAPKAKVLNCERVRFEVAGGNYRLVAAFGFRRQIAFVKFIGDAYMSRCRDYLE